MVEVYLSLGSNIDDKIKFIKTTYVLLERNENIKIIKKSNFYFSKAYKGKDLNDFVNSVIKIETTLKPLELLKYTKNIEKILGRKKTKINEYENRPIDIDIIFYGKEKFSKKGLVIPHKDMENRDFVLIPLCEIAPDMILPSGLNINEGINKLINTTEVLKDE